MRMVRHLPGPGVENADQANLSSHVFGVQGEGLQGGSGGLKEQIVHALLVRAGERAQCLGQCKGHEKVGDGEQERPLLFQPAGGLGVLALGTMPMLAGMIAVLQVAALLTFPFLDLNKDSCAFPRMSP